MLNIAVQPLTGLYSAYRPISFVVDANQFPDGPASAASPYILADVYYYDTGGNARYYATVSCTTHFGAGLAHFYYIDVQDKFQELLSTGLPKESLSPNLLPGPALLRGFMRFRHSYVDANGYTLEYETAPVAETFESDPLPGGGIQSDDFYVLNATIQHDEEFDLDLHLGMYPSSSMYQAGRTISHRGYPVEINRTERDYLTFNSTGLLPNLLYVAVTYKNGSGTSTGAYPSPTPGVDYGIYSCAVCIPNLEAMWPAIDWANVVAFTFGVYSQYSIGGTGYLVPVVFRQYAVCDCTEGRQRLAFVNAVGGWDTIAFDWNTTTNKWTAVVTQKTMPETHKPGRTSRGLGRQQVRQNDYTELIAWCDEEDLAWIKELAGSPAVYLQGQYRDFFKGKLYSLMPVVIEDSEVITLQPDQRYQYEVRFRYYLANSRINLRS